MRHILLVIVSLLTAVAARAAPPTQESVETLLTVTRVESMMDSLYTGMEQIMQQTINQSLAGKSLTPEQQQAMHGVSSKFMTVMREEFSWSKLKPLYIQLYRETFEQEELDGLIAFYKSPAGQAFIDKMPLVMQKSMAIAQEQMKSLLPKMRTAVAQAIAEAKIAK